MAHVRHMLNYHPRLIAAVIAGLVVGLVSPGDWLLVTRVLAGWNVAVWTYLMQLGWLMHQSTRARVRETAEREDQSAIGVLVMVSVAATLSLAAIVIELSAAKLAPPGLKASHYIFTAVTVMGSWLLVGVSYTLHYARIFYRSSERRRALNFPEGELHPTYSDFLYFSFTIAVAAATSDVMIMSPVMRKAVLAQSVLSFLFNAAIIGMSINIAAGLVGT